MESSKTSSYKKGELSRGADNATAQLQYVKSFLNSLQQDIQTKTSMIQEDPEAFLFKVQDDIESSISKQIKSLKVKEAIEIMEKEVQPRAEAKVFNQFATVADAVVELVGSIISVGGAKETKEPDDNVEADTVKADNDTSDNDNYKDNLVALADSMSGEWSVEDTVWTSRSVNFNAPVEVEEEEVTTNAKKVHVAEPVVDADPVGDSPEVEDRDDVVDANDIQVTRQESRAWGEDSKEKEKEQLIRQETVIEDVAWTFTDDISYDTSSYDSETVATVESSYKSGCKWNFGKTHCWVVE